MPFDGRVVVTPILPEGKRWCVVEQFSYTGKTDTLVVPRGTITDFASVPRVFTCLLPRYGRWTQAAILHDYLWSSAASGTISKFDANGVFNRALRELGVPFLRRWIMWTAVQWAAGPRAWLQRGPKTVIKMLAVSLPTLPVVLPAAIVIFVALIVGVTAEFITYLPLRLIHRDKGKDVNAPELSETLSS